MPNCDTTPNLKWRANVLGTTDILRVADPYGDGRFFILTLNHAGIGHLHYRTVECAISYARHEYCAGEERVYLPR